MSDTTAIATLKQYQGDSNALVLVNEEDLHTQRMFVPVVTKIPVTKADFHDYPIQGRMMPKSHHVDRIGEAAGVEFVDGGTRKEGENAWVGWAQGRRRMPDGSWRTSSVQEYEFNVDDRAEEDFLNDTKNRYNSEVAKRKHVIELRKAARQRASTGARLRVIRELVGIPIAFAKEDFQRALVVSRISLNTDEMLSDPSLRQAAVNHAVGAGESLFGPAERNVTPEAAQIEAPQEQHAEQQPAASDEDDFDLDAGDDEPIGADKQRVWKALDEYDNAFTLPPKAAAHIASFRADLRAASLEEMQKLLDWIKGWEKRQEGAAS